MLELQDQGFHPEATIADAGSGLRAGQALAMPEVPCRGDVFHALQLVQPLVTFLENRAYEAIATAANLATRAKRPKGANSRPRPRRHALPSEESLAEQLRLAAPGRSPGHRLGRGRGHVGPIGCVTTSSRWPVPDHATRCELYDFVVAELQARASRSAHIASARSSAP